MACIETMTFRLRRGADERAFLAADERVQQRFAYQQQGLLRRTTARGVDGEWLVLDLWASADDADAVATRWNADPIAAAFMSLVDEATVVIRRFETVS